MKDSKQYGIFEQVEFLNEGAVGVVAIAGLLGAAAIQKLIYNRKKKKDEEIKAAERAKKYEEECRQRAKDLEIFAKDCKKHYNISLEKLPKEYDDKEDPNYYKNVLNDVKIWVNKIINSKIFKDFCTELLADEERMNYIKDYYSNPDSIKFTISDFKSNFKVQEGPNGLNDGIQIIDASQQENAVFCWVCEEISKMIEIKYGFGSGTGDGDEGCIYY